MVVITKRGSISVFLFFFFLTFMTPFFSLFIFFIASATQVLVCCFYHHHHLRYPNSFLFLIQSFLCLLACLLASYCTWPLFSGKFRSNSPAEILSLNLINSEEEESLKESKNRSQFEEEMAKLECEGFSKVGIFHAILPLVVVETK